MTVRGSEVSAEYVSALRARNYSWSTIARMTGAVEGDLRRFHGGEFVEKPIEAKPVSVPAMVLLPIAIARPSRSKAKAVSKPIAPRRRKALTKADNRLVALLVASGIALQPAIILVRLYRASNKPLSLGEIMGSQMPEAEALASMATAYKAAKPFALSFRRSAKGYKLTNDSRLFLGRLEAVNKGGA